ncbi:MAG: IPT/TIG domain-containing protein [Prevotellaceae bacterium]|jgi:hypothetical protein|nr:IPT/TIG domain-containing protein [Prevotellaceae bacterium]
MKKIVLKRKTFICLWALSSFMLHLLSCKEEDSNVINRPAYDPSKPVVLSAFFPDSGRIRDKVILEGDNFGGDTSLIRVYFNKKQAKVIGSTGKRMYTVVPRLPGDTCTVSVVIGTDSSSYSSLFRYKASTNASTIVGNGSTDYKVGASLAETSLVPRAICVDDKDNIFTFTDVNDGIFLKINELENSVVPLVMNKNTGSGGVPQISEGKIVFPSDNLLDKYHTLDPSEGWALRSKTMVFRQGVRLPSETWKKNMAMCAVDSMYYLLFASSELVRINPKTSAADIVAILPAYNAYGMVFHPHQPNILWLSFSNYNSNAAPAEWNNTICTLDVTADDIAASMTRMNGTSTAGHRDGPLHLSQFNRPMQMFFDPEGNLYVADESNHCIRMINTRDNIVTTVSGKPGTPGFKDGPKEEALFRSPVGINVGRDGTIYVSDNGNARIRKIAFE